MDNLKTILAPILPHTANRLHEHLCHDFQLFGTRQAVEYPKKTRLSGQRSQAALTYDQSGAIGSPFAVLSADLAEK